MHRFDLDRMSGYGLSKEKRASLEFELEQLDEIDERKEKIIDKFYKQNKKFTFSNQDGLSEASIKYFEKNKIGNQTYKDYSKEKFVSDCIAGVIVGVVAIPLAIAFSIASGGRRS